MANAQRRAAAPQRCQPGASLRPRSTIVGKKNSDSPHLRSKATGPPFWILRTLFVVVNVVLNSHICIVYIYVIIIIRRRLFDAVRFRRSSDKVSLRFGVFSLPQFECAILSAAD